MRFPDRFILRSICPRHLNLHAHTLTQSMRRRSMTILYYERRIASASKSPPSSFVSSAGGPFISASTAFSRLVPS